MHQHLPKTEKLQPSATKDSHGSYDPLKLFPRPEYRIKASARFVLFTIVLEVCVCVWVSLFHCAKSQPLQETCDCVTERHHTNRVLCVAFWYLPQNKSKCVWCSVGSVKFVFYLILSFVSTESLLLAVLKSSGCVNILCLCVLDCLYPVCVGLRGCECVGVEIYEPNFSVRKWIALGCIVHSPPESNLKYYLQPPGRWLVYEWYDWHYKSIPRWWARAMVDFWQPSPKSWMEGSGELEFLCRVGIFLKKNKKKYNPITRVNFSFLLG